jgi:hypothetical protein
MPSPYAPHPEVGRDGLAAQPRLSALEVAEATRVAPLEGPVARLADVANDGKRRVLVADEPRVVLVELAHASDCTPRTRQQEGPAMTLIDVLVLLLIVLVVIAIVNRI